jgi:hypothetical protein
MMKVDMSREAVTVRLQTLEELWALSMKLMNAKKTQKSSRRLNGQSSNAAKPTKAD